MKSAICTTDGNRRDATNVAKPTAPAMRESITPASGPLMRRGGQVSARLEKGRASTALNGCGGQWPQDGMSDRTPSHNVLCACGACSTADAKSHVGWVVRRGRHERPPLGDPSFHALDDPSCGERDRRSATRPPRGPPRAAGTSTFRFPTTQCAILAHVRPTPTKERPFHVEAATTWSNSGEIGQPCTL